MTLNFYMIEAVLDVLMSDRADDSGDLDDDLRAKGNKLVSRTRKTGRKPKHWRVESVAVIKDVGLGDGSSLGSNLRVEGSMAGRGMPTTFEDFCKFLPLFYRKRF